jgi:hypothetical protein
MKNIHTLEEYKQYILTSSFWADSASITILEYILQMKLIILESARDNHRIVTCTEKIGKKGFKPQYYILVQYTGKTSTSTHYELVSYKNKKIFTFKEIPYGIKVSILSNCMENKENASVYSEIPEFKQFQEEHGVELATVQPEDESQESKEAREYGYDPSIVFSFFSKSSSDNAPGKNKLHEKIPVHRENDFTALKVKYPNWRQMLDDTWSQCYFLLDGHKWSSIGHYIIAKHCTLSLITPTQLKNETKYKEIYEAFSYKVGDETRPGNQHISMARRAIQSEADNKKTKNEKGEKGEKGEFYDVYRTLPKMSEEEKKEAQLLALKTKFQDPGLKEMLSLTRPAKLLHYNKNTLPTVEYELMKIRKSI